MEIKQPSVVKKRLDQAGIGQTDVWSEANNLKKRLDQAGVRQTHIRSGDQNRNMSIINKANMYRVIMRSDKAEAVKPAEPAER